MTAPSAQLSTWRVGGDPNGRWRLGVFGKRTWTVQRGACELAAEQVALVEEPLVDAQRAIVLHDADVLLHRTRTDVIVQGHAYPPDSSMSFEMSVQIGAFRRSLRAVGPRRVERGPYGDLRFTPPGFVDKIALDWENAYGGVDQGARAELGDPFEEFERESGATPDPRFGLFAYPRNPVGKGYVTFPTKDGLDACELPLLEDPGHLLTPATLVREDFVRWPEGPAVAAMGWLAHTTFPRSATVGLTPLVYDQQRYNADSFFEVRGGELNAEALDRDAHISKRLDLRAAQSAAIGMRALNVKPGDEVVLANLHPTRRQWRFQLPSERPRMAARLPDEKPLELTPQIRSVVLEPDLERVTLVWVAETAIDHALDARKLERIEHVVIWR